MLSELLAGVILVAILAYAALRIGAIDKLGAVSGAAISLIAFLAGGVPWLFVIITFFAVSSVMTKYRYDYKRKMGSAQEKGGKRSWPNTLANGGVSAIAAAGEIYFHSDLLAIAFLASLAAAMSDTLATEVGLLSRSRPRMITNLRAYVSPGTSGGVSFLGELTALLSALGIGALGVLISVVNANASQTIIAVVIGAFGGTTIDSLLGATIQAVKRCTVCGELTESANHHEHETVLVRGLRFVDNNTVNFLGILFGAGISVGIYLALA